MICLYFTNINIYNYNTIIYTSKFSFNSVIFKFLKKFHKLDKILIISD